MALFQAPVQLEEGERADPGGSGRAVRGVPRHYLDMEAGRVNPKLSTVIHIASESNISLDVLKSEVRGTHAVSLPPE